MDFGVGLLFPGTGRKDPDQVIYREQIALATLADELGFDSVWCTEHHFSEYQLTPDPLQLLTYLAGRTKNVRLGTNAVILPWNDPTRVVERVTALDTLADGRVLLGVGRGLGDLEFGGFGIPMDESRGRFAEAAAMIRDGLDAGYIESGGPFYQRGRREVRPRPAGNWRERRWAVAISPDSFNVVAELGFGLMCQPQKPWKVIKEETDRFYDRFTELHGIAPIPGITCAFVYCDRDPVKARDEAQRLIGGYHETVTRFYDLGGSQFKGVKGYEFYAQNSEKVSEAGPDAARNFYVGLQVWGTPDQCIEKIRHLREVTRCGTFVGNFHYNEVTPDDAKKMLDLFAQEVVPALRPLPKEVGGHDLPQAGRPGDGQSVPPGR